MVSRILIPLDGSDRAQDAVSVAQGLAARFKSAMTLLQVVADMEDSAAVETAQRHLSDVASRLRSLRFDVSIVVQAGSAFNCIATVAEVEHADLIVLAPHGETGIGHLRNLAVPSVTYRLVAHGSIPTLLVPPHAFLRPTVSFVSAPAAMEHPMVIALDGSVQAERIVPLASELACGLHQGIILARVVFESPSGTLRARSDDPRQQYDMDHRKVQQLLAEEREAHRYVATIRRSIVARTPVKVQTRVIAGDPAERLLQLALDVDASMLALASHGQGGLARVLLGSVATALMRHSPLLLLVAPGQMAPQSLRCSAESSCDEGEKPE